MSAPRIRLMAILVLLVLLALATVVGCSSNRRQVTGEWQFKGTQDTVRFDPGSSFISRAGPGVYTFTDATHVNLSIPASGVGGLSSGNWEVRFPDADTLILVSEKTGAIVELTRVK